MSTSVISDFLQYELNGLDLARPTNQSITRPDYQPTNQPTNQPSDQSTNQHAKPGETGAGKLVPEIDLS